MFASGESATALTDMFVLASKMVHFQTCDGHLGVLSWKVPSQVFCPVVLRIMALFLVDL